MSVTKFVIGIMILLIGWDTVTTYFGTVSIFTNEGDGFFSRLLNAELMVHIMAFIFSISIVTFILCYKHILRGDIVYIKGVLLVVFLYDFATSIYGTATAVGVFGYRGNGTFAEWAIILMLSVMATGAPLVIHQILED